MVDLAERVADALIARNYIGDSYRQTVIDVVREAQQGEDDRADTDETFWRTLGDAMGSGGMYDPAFLSGMVRARAGLPPEKRDCVFCKDAHEKLDELKAPRTDPDGGMDGVGELSVSGRIEDLFKWPLGRIRELAQEFGLLTVNGEIDVDTLKHRLEDHERWHRDLTAGRLIRNVTND